MSPDGDPIDAWTAELDTFAGPAALLRPRPWRVWPNAALRGLLADGWPTEAAFERQFTSAAGGLRDLLARSRPFEGRLRNDAAATDRRWRLLHADFAPLPDSDDWVCAFVDLSPVEDEHARLPLTLQHLQDTLHRLQGAISLVTRQEWVLFANAAYAAWFRKPLDQVQNRTVLEVMGEANHGWTAPQRNQLFATSQPVRYESVLVDGEGRDRVVDLMLQPILDERGVAARMAVLGRDVTARHLSMQAIRHTLERLDALFEAGIEGILLCGDDRVQDANPVAARHLGMPLEQLVGQPLQTLWPLLGQPAPDALAAETEGPGLQWCRLPDEDRPVPLSIRCIHFVDGGRPCQAVLLQDMRYRVQAQRRIDRLVADLRQQTARATAADRAKSLFLASASHDLRQPIHSLGLFLTTLQSLLRVPQPPDNAVLLPIARRMRASLASLTDLLDALLGATLMHTDGERISLQPVPLQPLFDSLLAEFGPLAAGKGLRLQAMPSRAWVMSDPVVLRRILGNLLANAVRYTARGRILIGARRRGDSMELQVWDTGVGIPADQMGAIFEAFYRVDMQARRNDRAEGLGLSIVKRAATQLGARLDVRSVERRGSMFSVAQPRCDAPTAVPAEEAPPPAAALGAAGCVLLIDDDMQVREATATLLRTWGHEVLAAGGAGQALLLCAAHPHRIDAVICDDIPEPALDALERLLRQTPGGGGPLRVCMVTGDVSEARLARARQRGIDLLHKPVSADALRRFLQRAA